MEKYISDNIHGWIVGEFDEIEMIQLIALEFIQDAINKKITSQEKVRNNNDETEEKKEAARRRIDALQQLRPDGGDGGHAQPAAAQSNATNN